MNINEIFKDAFCTWVRHECYECHQQDDDTWYYCPGGDADVTPYNPAEQIQKIALEVLNVGREFEAAGSDEALVINRTLHFVQKYGMLGLMVDLPLNENFLDTGKVYFASNAFVLAEQLDTDEYMKLFFPENTPKTVPSIAEFTHRSPVYGYVFSTFYMEQLILFEAYCMTMYRLLRACNEYRKTKDYARIQKLRQEVMRYSDHRLRYNIDTTDSPKIRWEFASLKAMIDLFIVGSITDAAAPLRECKHCGKVFYAENARLEFCTPQCRNKYNVYKFRRKEEDMEDGEA